MGPWQPVPLQLDPAFRARARDTCARDMEGQPGGIATIDARGEGVAIVRVQNRELIQCDALQITASGELTGAGGGSRGTGDGGGGAHGPNFGNIQVSRVEGGALTVEGWSVQGEAGEGILLVIVRPANGRPFVATVDNGWFAGWWPAQLPDDDPPPIVHFIVEGYDAQRVLRASFMH